MLLFFLDMLHYHCSSSCFLLLVTADDTDCTAAHLALLLILYVLTGMLYCPCMLRMQHATEAGTTLACLFLILAEILLNHAANLGNLVILHGNRTLKLSLIVIVATSQGHSFDLLSLQIQTCSLT